MRWRTATLWQTSVELWALHNDKKIHLFFFIQLRWARCDLYYIFTVTGRFWPKKTREWEGMGVILPGVEQFFRRIGTALVFFFVGEGRERFENPLPSHHLLYTSRVKKMTKKVTLDPSQPAHSLFELLSSGRRYRSLSTKTTRHTNIFSPRPYPTWTTHNTPQYCTSVKKTHQTFICTHAHSQFCLWTFFFCIFLFYYYRYS